jgi:hypothetical protein
MPVRIAFVDDSIPGWIAIDWVINLIFWIDIIINFFLAYFDSEDNLIINKKVIPIFLKDFIENHFPLFNWMVFD